MAASIEILVHVSGPSRGADDARYRREALGFLQFDDIAERHTLLGQELSAPSAVEQAEASTSLRAEQDANQSRLPDWQGRFPPSETPRFSKIIPSTIPWTAVKQTPHLLVERTPALPRPRTAPTSSTPAQAPPLRRSQSDSFQTPPSVIPDSQPTPPSTGLPELSSSPYLKRPLGSSSPSPSHHASPPSAKRPRLQIPSSPPPAAQPFNPRPRPTIPSSKQPSTTPPRRKAAPSSPPSANPPASTYIPSTHNPLPTTTTTSSPPTLEIHPPRPKPSTDAFKTHLTHSLAAIEHNLPLEKYFKPVTRTRTPDTLERGHWLIPIASWEEEWKTKFWAFLTDFVGRGSAGWGTWCVWEKGDAGRGGDGEGEGDGKDGGGERGKRRGEEVVKVYCWGEVVGEMWLLLFIGSGRKIKGVGVRWVDAGGEAVMVMG